MCNITKIKDDTLCIISKDDYNVEESYPLAMIVTFSLFSPYNGNHNYRIAKKMSKNEKRDVDWEMRQRFPIIKNR